MSTFLLFTILGIVSGASYAIAASGLVVTYTTSGIFNFAHGAIGMFMAFVYWELTVNRGWPTPLALVVVLFVLAPLMGAVIERVLMRKLHGRSTARPPSGSRRPRGRWAPCWPRPPASSSPRRSTPSTTCS